MEPTVKLYVREMATGKAVREFDVTGWGERRREKLIRGLQRQMNLEDFYVDDSEAEERDDA
jgi:hypothetical protein